MKDNIPNLCGIISKNSIDFIEQVFTCYEQQDAIVLLNNTNKDELQKQFNINKIIDPKQKTGWAKISLSTNPSEKIAQIAFTSGTEGKPKGIAITHANLIDTYNRLNSIMLMDDSIREYIGIPVYHSFGLGRCRAISILGGEFFIPSNGFNPVEIQEMLIARQINAISAVPSLWRSFFEYESLLGKETEHVKWIEIGSQYMSADEKKRLKNIFPNATIVQHYGLTEASRTTFLEIHKEGSDQALESVGKTIGDTKIKCDKDGVISIHGSCVAKQQYIDGKLEPLTDEDGWLKTSDLGEIDNGLLTFKGRADDIINCGGVKISPDFIEKELRSHTDIETGFACSKIPDPQRGEGILISYEKNLDITTQKIYSVTEKIFPKLNINPKQSIKLMEVDTLPRTKTGKTQRKKLTEIYILQKLANPLTNEGDKEQKSNSREAELVAIWKNILNIDSVGTNENFYDLGGDSLTAISAIVKMKKLGIPDHVCKAILKGYTIEALVRIENEGNNQALENLDLSKPENVTSNNNLNIKVIRGLLVLFVIFAHWSDAIFERLPLAIQNIKFVFAPILSFGTPGFAIMYGVAMGYGAYPLFDKTPERFRKRIIPIFSILLIGILCLGALRILYKSATIETLSLTNITNSFYDVLTYYLLATATIYLWFMYLKSTSIPILSAFLTAAISHLIYLNYMIPIQSLQTEGFLELGKLLLSGKYSYFNMTCGVFIGLGFGITLTKYKSHINTKQLLITAILLIGTSALYSVASEETAQWLIWPVSRIRAWQWLFYSGVCIIMFICLRNWISVYQLQPRLLQLSTEIIACFGFLAFPFFVTHAMVLYIKNLLVHTGLNNSEALLISLGGFIILSTAMLYKSHQLQFSK